MCLCRQHRDVQEALWRPCITSSSYHRIEKDLFTNRASMYCGYLLFQYLKSDNTKAIASTLSSETTSMLPRFAVLALPEIQCKKRTKLEIQPHRLVAQSIRPMLCKELLLRGCFPQSRDCTGHQNSEPCAHGHDVFTGNIFDRQAFRIWSPSTIPLLDISRSYSCH